MLVVDYITVVVLLVVLALALRVCVRRGNVVLAVLAIALPVFVPAFILIDEMVFND